MYIIRAEIIRVISKSNKRAAIADWPIRALALILLLYKAPYYPISSLLSVSGRLLEVKNERKFQTVLALKVVAVAYERWSLSSGFQSSDLAEKLLVFWKTGRWGELAAYDRWSQPEVRLYPENASFNFLLPTEKASNSRECLETKFFRMPGLENYERTCHLDTEWSNV